MQPVLETEPIIETRGDDWIWPLALLGDDDVPVDLGGCAFDGAALKWAGGALDLTAANGRLVVAPAAGGITVTIARSDTSAVPDGQRARLVVPILDTQNRKSTLLIVPILVIAP
jgi:hypothetical protein